jgi:PAS domain S-box-containing protein
MTAETRMNRILLVEDEPLIAISERKMLEAGGYRTRIAASADEALILLADEDPDEDSFDMVLMDIDLGPGMDGIECARRILNMKQVPLLFLTSHTEADFASRAETVSSYGYMLKGSAPAAIFATMRMAFRLFEAQTENIRSREEYRRVYSAVAGSINAIALADMDGILTYVNKSFIDLWGFADESEVIGRNASEFWADVDGASEAMSKSIADGRWEGELLARRTDGITRQVYVRTNRVDNEDGTPNGLVGAFLDMSSLKIRQQLTEAWLNILDYAEEHDSREIMTRFLDEAEKLTGSCIGFFHSVDEDEETIDLQTWSTNTIQAMCDMEASGKHYPIDQGGIWVEPLKTREPVIHNDYTALNRDGRLPDGHTPLTRELVVPVIRSGKVVAILGVGNKSELYSTEDMSIVQHFADMAFEIIMRKQADAKIRKLLREKELLLKEVHHRIKNNMFNIRSMLSLQSDELENPEAKKALSEAQGRIDTMLILYQQLYQGSNIEQADLGEYLEALITEIRNSLPPRIQIEALLHPLEVDPNKVFAIGIIVNELITNAVKYAFPGERAGKIEVDLRTAAEGFSLRIADNGVGIADATGETESSIDGEESAYRSGGFGLELVRSLTAQYSARLRFSMTGGSEFILDFPD